MTRDPRDEFSSPLDEVFQELPEEEVPEDLRQRCMGVLREKPRAASRRTWAGWGTALAAAASVMLVIGVASFLMTPKAKRVAMQASTKSSPLASPAPATLAEGPAGGPGMAGPAGGASGVGGPPPAGGMGGGGSRSGRIAGEAETRYESDARAFDRVVPSTTPPLIITGESSVPTKPWRDQSGERQRIVSKEMAVEVDDVERAHEQATGIIEKAGGFVDSEDMEIGEDEPARANLQARVPVDALDGVIAQMRRLGHVTRLSGNSQDRTAEYVGQGSSIREAGGSEVELVARYEKEPNRHRKQQLYAQIQALRAENKARKQQLLGLSDQTHYAFLDLTLAEVNSGLRHFLRKLGGNALQVTMWLGATAVVWVPLLVIAIVLWRRYGRVSG